MKIDLSDKIALVTGGSGDLGRVICRTLAGCGAKVAIQYHHNAGKADSLVAEIRDQGAQAMAIQCDVTEQGSIDRMRNAIVQGLGEVDILVNSAVIQYEPKKPVLEQSLSDYEGQFRSCVLQNVLMAQIFAPAMISRRWGRIIGINTECVMLYNELHSAYVAGKRGMDGVLRVLAKEIGVHQITVNQIAPGFMISDRDRALDRLSIPWYEEHVPLRRRGEDQDVANAVAFLSSDLAAFITGAILPVCGGHIMPAI